jgi:hypothetical protein
VSAGPAAAEAQVAALLDELKRLTGEIRRAREELAPLEAGLETAAREYRDAVAPLEREARRLRAELDALVAPVAPDPVPVAAAGGSDRGGGVSGPVEIAAPAPPPDPEAVDKNVLLEHLYRVLDGMDPEGGAVVAEVQGLVQDPQATLVDALEQVPWGPGWTDRSAVESAGDQVTRLRTWSVALARRRDDVRAAAARLQTDSRYPLWRRREAGAEAWQAFLAEVVEERRRENEETATQVAELRDEGG